MIPRIASLLCLITLGLGTSGCVPVIVGGAATAGAYAYATGELKDTLNASPQQTRRAIESALQRLNLRVLSQSADGLTGQYELRTGDERRVLIRYQRVADLATKVTIRVGVLGDPELSNAILREIEIAL